MADHRHKRDANARRRPRVTLVAGPLASLATVGAVTLGVVLSESPAEISAATLSDAPASNAAAGLGAFTTPDEAVLEALRQREDTVSRSGGRDGSDAADFEALGDDGRKAKKRTRPAKLERVLAPAAVRKAVNRADTEVWTTTALNIWTEPGESAKRLGEVAGGKKVLVTGRSLYGRDEVVLGGKSRWVTSGYFSAEKPEPAPTVGASCTNGSSVPSGVSSNVKAVHQAVCGNFSELTSYGTFRSDGEHSQGIAIDIMVSGDRGWQVANFVRENYQALGVSYVIYAQRIWSVERGGEGWRPMSDRGSATANHYDHVHVTTY